MQGKNPTRKQAMLITAKHLNSDNWLVIKDLTHEMHIKYRYTDTVRVIPKSHAGR